MARYLDQYDDLEENLELSQEDFWQKIGKELFGEDYLMICNRLKAEVQNVKNRVNEEAEKKKNGEFVKKTM